MHFRGSKSRVDRVLQGPFQASTSTDQVLKEIYTMQRSHMSLPQFTPSHYRAVERGPEFAEVITLLIRAQDT